jgi:hypothetical protein
MMLRRLQSGRFGRKTLFLLAAILLLILAPLPFLTTRVF